MLRQRRLASEVVEHTSLRAAKAHAWRVERLPKRILRSLRGAIAIFLSYGAAWCVRRWRSRGTPTAGQWRPPLRHSDVAAAAPPVSAQLFWEHAKKLTSIKFPGPPLSRKLGVNLATGAGQQYLRDEIAAGRQPSHGGKISHAVGDCWLSITMPMTHGELARCLDVGGSAGEGKDIIVVWKACSTRWASAAISLFFCW